MSSAALALLVAAAVAHAGWNLLVKEARDRQVFMGVALVVAAVALAPAWISYPALPRMVWPLILTSAVAEAAYFALLVAMYAVSDFSLAYPVARGAAPIFLVLWAALFLDQVPSRGGFVGLAILACGLLIVATAGLIPWGWRFGPKKEERRKAESAELERPRAARWRSVALALCGSVCISTYTAIDGFAMQYTVPAPYLAAVLGLTALLIMPLVLGRYGVAVVAAEWRRSWWRILLVGGGMAFTYQLVLWAFRLAPIPYVGAVREISVVFGALAGWLLLGERLGPTRVVGSLVIFAGVMLIVALG
jgi:drug/metabolite transporter (DMT)-like permease